MSKVQGSGSLFQVSSFWFHVSGSTFKVSGFKVSGFKKFQGCSDAMLCAGVKWFKVSGLTLPVTELVEVLVSRFSFLVQRSTFKGSGEKANHPKDIECVSLFAHKPLNTVPLPFPGKPPRQTRGLSSRYILPKVHNDHGSYRPNVRRHRVRDTTTDPNG